MCSFIVPEELVFVAMLMICLGILWHSVRNTNAINEHIALPNVYNNIKNL